MVYAVSLSGKLLINRKQSDLYLEAHISAPALTNGYTVKSRNSIPRQGKWVENSQNKTQMEALPCQPVVHAVDLFKL